MLWLIGKMQDSIYSMLWNFTLRLSISFCKISAASNTTAAYYSWLNSVKTNISVQIMFFFFFETFFLKQLNRNVWSLPTVKMIFFSSLLYEREREKKAITKVNHHYSRFITYFSEARLCCPGIKIMQRILLVSWKDSEELSLE